MLFVLKKIDKNNHYDNYNTTTTTTTTTSTTTNNNNNKYWVDVQRGIVSSHGEGDPL